MVNSVSNTSSVNNNKTVREKTLQSARRGFIGSAIAGAYLTYISPTWLNKSKDAPSDKYVATVKKYLEKDLSLEKQLEYKKIKNFFHSLVDSQIPLNNLRGQIEQCDELKNALPLNYGEGVKEGLDRIFSNKNTKELKESLIKMQEKTKIDKAVSSHYAKDLIIKNLDTSTKMLVKSETTSDKMFKMLQKAKYEVKLKNSWVNALTLSSIGAILGLWIGALKNNKDSKK